MRIRAKITSKGQITIPSEIRDYLKLDCGDHIEFVKEGDRIYLSPKNMKLASMAGLLGTPPNGKTATLEEMEATIAETAIATHNRVPDDRT
jgi:AbrB family looped-hinge helix DNA binding protein